MKMSEICDSEYNRMLEYREHQKHKNFFFVNNRQMLNRLIPDGSTVLDYGCGKGTLGDRKNIHIDYYDRDKNNPIANYHDINEINNIYDFIIFSHVIEHMKLEEIEKVLKWALNHSERIIISLPNTSNIFLNFYSDLSHVRPYDNLDFIFFVEKQGFKIEGIFKNDVIGNTNKVSALFRFIFSMLLSTSPFYNYTFICKRDKKVDYKEM